MVTVRTVMVALLGSTSLLFPAVSYSSEPAKYAVSCGACHNTAVAGAPKTHDATAWKPRLAKGLDAMVDSVKNGLNVMPPGGNCADCSDAELKELIEFMSAPKPTG